MKVLIVVTHLLGTGHLARALVLGRAFASAGHNVVVASGGMPAPHLQAEGVRVVQLPPLRSDGVNFRTLLDQHGVPVSSALLTARKQQLQATLTDCQPDALITELYPFGRRVLADEFQNLLFAATAQTSPPVICASIRDILTPPSKLAKTEATHELIARFYTSVLVHSDATVAPLDVSWPVAPELAAKLQYTGFVAPAPAGPHLDALGCGEILVTTGGGSVGMRLFKTALESAALDPKTQWRLLVGGANAPDRIARLKSAAPSNTQISLTSPAFRQMLTHAAASVSFCGYNTALDVLQAGTPAVFVPFDDGGEVEQSLRAGSLAHLSGIEVLRTQALSATTLMDKVNAAITAPARGARTKGFQGASETVRIVSHLVADRAP